MKDLDELFRGGLGDRKPEVPQDLWNKISARRQEIPSEEEIDQLFATKLAQRQPAVPAGMWERILRARRRTPLLRYVALALLLIGLSTWLFVAGTQENAIQETATVAGTQIHLPPTPPPGRDGVSPAAYSEQRKVPSALPIQERGAAGSPGARIPEEATKKEPLVFEARDTRIAPPSFHYSATQAVDALPFTAAYGVESTATPDLPAPAAPLEGRTFRRVGGDRLQLEFLAGAAYAHQSFGNTGGEARELRNMREVSEFPQLSYQFSARLQYRLRPRWRLLTGLTYVDIRNQLEYETTGNAAKELIRSNNHLRMLEVPVLASYVVSGRRLRLNVNAGPVINLFTAVDGQYIHPAFAQPKSLGDDTGYRSNIGVGWTASLTTTYLVGKSRTTQLLVEPFFKSYPGSFTGSEAPLSEHYWLAGLQLGLRKSF